jgi:hypothetical protein
MRPTTPARCVTTRARRRRPYRPQLEALDVRNLLSTYTVDHLADDVAGDGAEWQPPLLH